MDLKSVLEEVALEGLDGITLDALWLRILTRPGNSPGCLDDHVKEYIWKNLASCQDLQFFKLPKPRPDLIITDYREHVYQCRCLLKEYPVDIYSIVKVEKDGNLGSCDDYDMRVSISAEIRGESGDVLLTVDEANDKWGQQLVIVANQSLRFQALFSTNYLPTGVNAEAYCLLERVGRARFVGDITLPMPSGRGLLNKYYKTSNLFATVKYLNHRGFLRKQPFNIRFTPLGKNYHVRLIHLNRFYAESSGNFLRLLHRMCDVLKTSPDKRLKRQEVLDRSGVLDEDVKKHWSTISKYIRRDIITYQEMFPNSTKEEYLCRNQQARKVVTYTMIKPYLLNHDNLEDEDDDDDDEEDIENFKDGQETEAMTVDEERAAGHLQLGMGPLYEKPFIRSLQYTIDQAGPKGIAESKISQILGLHKKCIERVLAALVANKSVIRVPIISRTTCIYLLVSAKYEPETLLSIQKTDSVSVDDEMDTVHVKEEKEDAMAILEEPSTSKSGEGNENEAQLDSSTLSEKAISMDEEELDKTLAELELTWRIERASEPKQMGEAIYKQSELETVYKANLKNGEEEKKRRELILNYLQKHRVIVSEYELRKKIMAWETEQGWKSEMCRKSYVRIVGELYDEGKICNLIVDCSQHPSCQEQVLKAANDIQATDKPVKECILHFYVTKYKFFVSLNKNKQTRCKTLSDLVSAPFSYSETLTRLSCGKEENIRLFKQSMERRVIPLARDAGKLAKITRARELHSFMFYLLYDYPEEARAVDRGLEERVDMGLLTSGTAESVKLPVYLDVQDWRRHVPPLKIHNTKFLNKSSLEGVCMLGDILMAIPIEVLGRIICFDWQVEGLAEILQDPEQRLRLLYTIPGNTLRDLCHRRKYIRKIVDAFNILCQMGLASYGPSSGLRALEYTVCYLHKKGMMLDTMNSQPGHLFTRVPPPKTEFPAIHFELNSLNDIEVYWKEAQLICMATSLGHCDPVDEPGFHGEITVADAIKPRPFEDIREDNWLPGDRRGAGGFDSSLFLHQMRNWDCKKFVHRSDAKFQTSGHAMRSMMGAQGGRRSKKRALSASRPADTVKKAVKKARENLAPKVKQPRKRKREKETKDELKKKNDEQKTEKDKVPKVKRPKLYLDEEDKKAKMEMARMRCNFSPFENGIFLLCHVVSHLFCPKDLHFRLPAADFRAIFRSLAPEASKDKTTHAIRGKSARLIKDRNFLSHMGIYLARSFYDEELIAEYKDFKFSQSPKCKKLMYDTLYSVVQRLLVKFSSPKQPLPYAWPLTTSEFHHLYSVKLSLDLEQIKRTSVPKAHFNTEDPFEVRAFVLWNFILGWMHSKKTISNVLVYHILCKYDERAVNKTHNSLKTCRVMYTHKKYSYHQGNRKLSKGDQVVNNLVLSRRHKEHLMTHFPLDLFQNVWKQMKEWTDHFNKRAHRQNPLSSSSLSSSSLLSHGDKTAGSKDNGDGSDGLVEKEKDRSIPSTSTSEGCTSGVGCGASGSDDTQTNQAGGEKKEGDVVDPYVPMKMQMFHGGSVLALLPLMALELLDVDVTFPDDMVKLSEEGIEELQQKAKSRKRKVKDPGLDTSLEDSNDEGKPSLSKRDKNWRVLQPSSNRKRYAGQSHSSAGGPDDDHSPKEIQYANVTMRFKNEERQSKDILTDFAMSFASGTLLALARTNLINDIDLLNTTVNVQRFFVANPLVMKFSLKSCVEFNENGNENAESLSKNQDVNMSPSSGTEKVPKAAIDKRVTSSLSAFYSPELYTTILTRLEQSFPNDFGDKDVYQELNAISEEGGINGEWVEQGRSLYSVIDSFGVQGASEIDLENKLDKPFIAMRDIIDQLCGMNALSIYTIPPTPPGLTGERLSKSGYHRETADGRVVATIRLLRLLSCTPKSRLPDQGDER